MCEKSQRASKHQDWAEIFLKQRLPIILHCLTFDDNTDNKACSAPTLKYSVPLYKLYSTTLW